MTNNITATCRIVGVSPVHDGPAWGQPAFNNLRFLGGRYCHVVTIELDGPIADCGERHVFAPTNAQIPLADHALRLEIARANGVDIPVPDDGLWLVGCRVDCNLYANRAGFWAVAPGGLHAPASPTSPLVFHADYGTDKIDDGRQQSLF